MTHLSSNLWWMEITWFFEPTTTTLSLVRLRRRCSFFSKLSESQARCTWRSLSTSKILQLINWKILLRNGPLMCCPHMNLRKYASSKSFSSNYNSMDECWMLTIYLAFSAILTLASTGLITWVEWDYTICRTCPSNSANHSRLPLPPKYRISDSIHCSPRP
jgi:hypothetical protein